MSLSSHQTPVRGATDIWLTPPEIIQALGPFDLDPCAAPSPRPWPTAAQHIALPTNGLTARWKGHVWLNPPFGPEAEKWLERLGGHGDGVALVAARTETRWFVSQVWNHASSLLFLHGRPHFHYPDGRRGYANSGVPIVLAGYGDWADENLERCGLRGSYVSTWRKA